MLNNNKIKKWVFVELAQSLVRPFGAIAVLFGLVSLSGYLWNIEVFYRPVANGPATNPLTAMCIILIGVALYNNRQHILNINLQRVFSLLALLFTCIRLLDAVFQTDNAALIMPFHDYVLQELATGKNNSMGVNSALMLFCITLAVFIQDLMVYV